MVGQTLSHYRILKKLGAGGMGEVYLAHDTKLDRSIALKILPSKFASDQDGMRRFIREAKAASAINHANVAHIYEIGDAEGIHFIAMEYVEGQTLASRLHNGPLQPAEVVRAGAQIAAALEEAHRKGIIHRDLKPANIILSPSGQIKLLDFGLAKVTLSGDPNLSSALSTLTKTDLGMVMGTLPYMSPEQLRGDPLDHRTDLYSLGVTLYELSTGQLPSQGKTAIEMADAILHKECPSAEQSNKNIPRDLAKVISKMLAKSPDSRYQDAAEVRSDLDLLGHRDETAKSSLQTLRRRSVAITAAVLIVALLSFVGWMFYHESRARWARNVAVPQVIQLADHGKYAEAVPLALKAERFIPNDPILQRLWSTISTMITIQTEPPGAEIFMKEYRAVENEWKSVGHSPIERMRIPAGYFRWKISKPGFATIDCVAPKAFYEGEGTRGNEITLQFTLNPEQAIPQAMVRIPGGEYFALGSRFQSVKEIKFEDYWMDRYEVTNKEFKKFVDGGGYQKSQYWKQPFLKDGHELSWKEAMVFFHDSTGRAGPLDWEVGQYPEGKADYPVTGVSWYEAAAFAEFAGKSLPTIYHWDYAAGTPMCFLIAPLSNFSGSAPHPAGSVRSMSPFGTYDMAGNVKEWCWNGTTEGKRFILGGAFNEPEYLALESDQRFPFDRDRTFGFRCVKYGSAIPSALLNPLEENLRDYRKEKPVSDEVFEVFKGFYSYDKKDLNAKLESTKEERDWKKETVTFDAAYGNERMLLHLFLPKTSLPPYQTVIYFPGTWARWRTSSEKIEDDIGYLEYLDFLVRSGRAGACPIYKGTYERGGGSGSQPVNVDQERNQLIQEIKDVSRTIDYLETRSDIDKDRLVFYGYSWGGRVGPIVGAIEPRFRVVILAHGGLPLVKRAPEIDQINFAPRVKMPVLMIDGRYDHVAPVETSQKPLFNFLGTQPKDKLHLVFDGTHAVPRQDTIRAVLDWLDRYLGPVKPSS
jgi:eukaryotic-like serine/threonine-protein kinase